MKYGNKKKTAKPQYFNLQTEVNSLEEMYLTLEENDKRIERQRMREKGEEKKERG